MADPAILIPLDGRLPKRPRHRKVEKLIELPQHFVIWGNDDDLVKNARFRSVVGTALLSECRFMNKRELGNVIDAKLIYRIK